MVTSQQPCYGGGGQDETEVIRGAGGKEVRRGQRRWALFMWKTAIRTGMRRQGYEDDESPRSCALTLFLTPTPPLYWPYNQYGQPSLLPSYDSPQCVEGPRPA